MSEHTSPDQEIIHSQSVKFEARSFSGPLPPPEVLERYNQILPGAADRIIAMAEAQNAHRQHIEKTVIGSNAFSEKVGPILGFIIAMTAILAGTWLISIGKSSEGLTSIIGALVGLVSVFVYGKYEQKKDLKSKANSFKPPLSE